MNNPKTENTATRWLIVIIIIIVSILLPGQRSYAQEIPQGTVMTVDANKFLEYVAHKCSETGAQAIARDGLLPGMDYQQSLNAHTSACTKAVVNHVTAK